jgi:hypothetical protein
MEENELKEEKERVHKSDIISGILITSIAFKVYLEGLILVMYDIVFNNLFFALRTWILISCLAFLFLQVCLFANVQVAMIKDYRKQKREEVN